MSLAKRRTITKDAPLTTKEMKNFISKIEIGDIVPTIVVASKHWISTISFVETHKAANVRVVKKLPYQVITDHGIMTWTDFILGYYSGIIPAMLKYDCKDAKEKAA